MTTLIQDLRYAARALWHGPSFAATAICTLAIAIGATTATFSVIRAVLLRPLPYRDPGRLAMLWTDLARQGIHNEASSFQNISDWRAQSKTIEDLAIWDPLSVTLTGGSTPEKASAARVSRNFFSLLGAAALAGRAFTTEEFERGERVALIGEGLWRQRFGEMRDLENLPFEIDGVRVRIVGVVPSGFDFPSPGDQIWEPHTVFPDWPQRRLQRAPDSWRVLARLKDGVTAGAAQAELSAIAQRLEAAYPDTNRGAGIRVVPLDLEITGRNTRLALWVLFTAVVFVLGIACANIANLLLARGGARRREIALRAALGARRGRIVRQFLTESALLSLLAGLAGLAVASALIPALVMMAPAGIRRITEAQIDAPVLLFALAVSLLAGVLFGVAPAIRFSRGNLNAGLRGGERGSSPGAGWGRHALIVIETALAMILLAGAGLLLRSFLAVSAVDPGFRADRVLSMGMSVARDTPPERTVAIFEEAIERIEGLPAVEAAGATGELFLGLNPDHTVDIEGRPLDLSAQRQLSRDPVTPGFFETLGVPLLAGRFFDSGDRVGSLPVAIVNKAMAEHYWPGENAIGKRFRGAAAAEVPWLTVAGVTGDMRRQGPDRAPVPQYFQPLAQRPRQYMVLMVRGEIASPGFVASIRTAVAEADPSAPLYSISTLSSEWSQRIAERRFQSWLLGLFSVAALVLAAIGIFGLTQFAVAQRTREIGIRMALGARGQDVAARMALRGVAPAAAGIGIGLAGALAISRTMAGLLFGTSPSDPLSYAGTACLLLIVAAAGCYLPARRASRVDPVAALRQE